MAEGALPTRRYSSSMIICKCPRSEPRDSGAELSQTHHERRARCAVRYDLSIVHKVVPSDAAQHAFAAILLAALHAQATIMLTCAVNARERKC